MNTGHGSKGWTLAFGSIKLLADLISQTKPEVNLNKNSLTGYNAQLLCIF